MNAFTIPARPLTGARMSFILVSFFGVVIVVNFTMAYLAVTTFTGTVVDNSYVASQKFNGWLAEARTEKALGWQTAVSLDQEQHVIVRVTDKAGQPLAPLDVQGNVSRAMINAPPTQMHFYPIGAGAMRSRSTLPQGRWQIQFNMVSGTHHARATEALR